MIRSFIASAVALSAAPAALADFTAINTSGANGEPVLKQIVQNYYGGTFVMTGPGNVNMTNGVITLTRVRDFVGGAGGPTGLLEVNGSNLGSADDNRWSDGVVQIIIRAAYAGNDNTLGWYNNLNSPSTFRPLLGDTPGGSTVVTLSENFEWGLKSVSSSSTNHFTSNKYENSGDKDHFVTYRVTGPNGLERWLIAAEDLKHNSDWDFNDWVGEVEVVVAIPLPPAAWAGLGVLGLIAGARVRRGLRR